MNWAEERATEHFDKRTTRPLPIAAEDPQIPENYINAKKINKGDPLEVNEGKEVEEGSRKQPKDILARHITLRADDWFGTEVNHTFSSVHVPTSIYDLRKLSNYFLSFH